MRPAPRRKNLEASDQPVPKENPMTVIDTQEKPVERGAGEKASSKRPEHDERHGGDPTESDEAARREDPFALDPLSPPSGRPW
jgi:hypothetical protein